MSRPRVPKYGNWAMGDVTSYTLYFDEAREGRNNTGKMINPNDPSQDLSKLIATNAPQAQHKPQPPNRVSEPIVRGAHGVGRGGGRGGGRAPTNYVRPVRQSVGSEHSFEKSHLHPNNQSKIALKVGSSSPSRDGKRPANLGRENYDRGAALPIFGEWDEKNPSSAEGYTEVFNKVREERQTGSVKSPKRVNEPSYPPRQKYNDGEVKCCCFPWGRK